MSTASVGASGEHYVLSQLLRRGWIAALAPGGTADVDILVTDKKYRAQHTIQVKTRRGKQGVGNWPMRKKHEELITGLFYVFVEIGEDPSDVPVCYILPSDKVAEVIRLGHQAWLKTPRRDGGRHNDSPARRMCHDYSNLKAEKDFVDRHGLDWLARHKDAWHFLGKPEP